MAAKANDNFWLRQRPAAVLKHAVLSQYLVPFASKTGSSSKGKRVVFVDGYAGRGRYDDGTAGSPVLLAEAAKTVSSYRSLECHFVEAKRDTYERLVEVMTAETEGLTWYAHRGPIEEHLDTLLAAAEGSPLFLFLDPFGFSIPFDDMVGKVFARPNHRYAPATEVLLNFSANAVRRTAAVIDSTKPNKAQAAQLEALTRFCGGDWWQELWRKKIDNEHFNDMVAAEYRTRIRKATGCLGAGLAVRNRERRPPVYHLVFLTWRNEGLYEFTEAASRAGERWREALFYAEDFGELEFDRAAAFGVEEAVRAREWHDIMRSNVQELLRKHQQFTVAQKFPEVFRGVLGQARCSPHLRAVLKELYDEGATSSDSRGDLLKKVVVRK